MSLRREQYWALKKTQDFLCDLLFTNSRPKTVKELKHRASACLRHFPFLDDDGKPMFSRDGFGPDEPPTR
jgi:hypothetical protein